MFKTNYDDVFELMGLDKNKPFAEGLEPTQNVFGLNAENQKDMGSIVEKQYNYNYLHNVSNSKLGLAKDTINDPKMNTEDIFEYYTS